MRALLCPSFTHRGRALHPRRAVLLLVLLLATPFLLPHSASAVVITVCPDGTCDFTTIGDAVVAAGNNDIIEVGPGIYPEHIEITKVLQIHSTHGASQTTIDGENDSRILEYKSGGGGELRGFKLINGSAIGSGGAILALLGTVLDVYECVFENNSATFDGGAFIIAGNTTDVSFTRCDFRHNHSSHSAGAGNSIQGAILTIVECTFFENSTEIFSGAVQCNDGTMFVTDCLFDRNRSFDVAGAIYYFRSIGLVQNNTFYQNTSLGRATIVVHQSPGVTVDRNIISWETNGFGLQFLEGVGAHSCNLFWANALGNIDGDDLAPDDTVANPLFCNPFASDFALFEMSPAAAENSPCGLLIGAFPVQCGTVAVEEVTWGVVKALYRGQP